MKKLLKVLVVCLATAMMLAGCGNGGNGGTSNEGGQTDGENSGIPTDHGHSAGPAELQTGLQVR